MGTRTGRFGKCLLISELNLNKTILNPPMAPLPFTIPTNFAQRSDYANTKSAYDRCLREERRLMEQRDQGPNTQLRLISIRILGYLIHHAPTDVAVGTVVDQIHSCKEDAHLYDVGDLYFS